MEYKVNSEYTIQTIKLIIKTMGGLLPGEIILHPIFRDDGLMLVNRYSTVFQNVLKQIHIHLRDDIPVIVVTSEEELNKFLNNEVYSDQDFISLLEEAINNSESNYKVSLELDSYLDNRVNKKNLMRNKKSEVQIQNTDRYSILGKLISSTPLWSSFETLLESEFLQTRAKDIKKKFLSIINDDKSLMELVDKMVAYDDLLLIDGMNAASISMLIGLTMELSDEEMVNLAISALFCNIGFISISKDMFYKYLEGSNYIEIANKHIKNSLEIITESSYCRNKSIVFGILDHHEYYNGSGTPSGKLGKEIGVFARILNIVHEYDDLVIGAFGKEAMNANSAANVIWANKEKRFDPDILKIFFYRSKIFKIGQTFIDPKNNKGTIIGFRNFIENPAKPIVKYNNDKIIDFYDYDWKVL